MPLVHSSQHFPYQTLVDKLQWKMFNVKCHLIIGDNETNPWFNHKDVMVGKLCQHFWSFVRGATLDSSKRGKAPDSVQRCRLTSIGNPIMEIRRSADGLISTMGIPILVRWHLGIESGPSNAELWPLTILCLSQLLNKQWILQLFEKPWLKFGWKVVEIYINYNIRIYFWRPRSITYS